VQAWQAIVKVGTAIQTAFNAVMAANPIMLAVIAIAALVAGLTYFFTQTETGRQIWQSFTQLLTDTWQAITGAWESFASGFAAAWNGFWDGVKAVFTAIWDGLTWYFRLQFEAWKAVLTFFVGLFMMGWEALWGWIGPYVTAVWDALKAGWQFLWDTFTAAWTVFSAWITGAWETTWGAVSGFFTTIWETISSYVSGVLSAISAAISGALAAISGVRHSMPSVRDVPSFSSPPILPHVGLTSRMWTMSFISICPRTCVPIAIVRDARHAQERRGRSSHSWTRRNWPSSRHSLHAWRSNSPACRVRKRTAFSSTSKGGSHSWTSCPHCWTYCSLPF